MDHIANLRIWLDSLDGSHVAAAVLGVFLVLWAYCELVNARARYRARVRGPRRKGPTDLLERLDREAPTRPVSSGRKASRTAVR